VRCMPHAETATVTFDLEGGRRADVDRPRRLLGAEWPLAWSDAGVLLLAYGVLVGVFTAVGLIIKNGGTLEGLDMDVGQWFVDQRSTTLNDLSPWGAGLADTFSKIIVTAIIAVVMLRVWKRWVEPLVVVVTLIFEASVFITVTRLVGRPRPPFAHLQDSPVNSSFPSGHVAAAAAYAAISLVWSWHVRSRSAQVAIWSIPVVITTVVALSRLYQAMHFLTDVFFGIVLGVTSVAICALVVTRARVRMNADAATSS
jgi:membrane-associated phospholipid phosphatase